ncbi:MAG: hypothetical protein WCR20_23640 [Verrucomicrobiota bacterium]
MTTMLKSSLTRKIILIIAATLFIGFAGLGILSIYLEYTAIINLQRVDTRQLASAVTHDILNQITKKEFKFLELVGAVFGMMIGIVQVLVQSFIH